VISIVLRTLLIQLIGVAVLVIPVALRKKTNKLLLVTAGVIVVWVASVVFFPPELKNMEIMTLVYLVVFLLLQTTLFSVACVFVKLVRDLRMEKGAD